MELEKDFREFIELLNKLDVQYLVIGGFAVNFHGYPRYTKDIDLWLWIAEENINRLMKALNEFGFGDVGLKKDDFLNPENIIQLGYEPYRIDLVIDVEGINFQECYKRKVVADLEEIKINFLSLQDLIDIKKKTGRPQDLADADQLEKLKNKMNE